MGITLISIPFWWDESLASLAATVKTARPDLINVSIESAPIPSDIPQKYQTKKYKPNVAQVYSSQINFSGW
jgi:hypothetical protein